MTIVDSWQQRSADCLFFLLTVVRVIFVFGLLLLSGPPRGGGVAGASAPGPGSPKASKKI